jgi:hypothetical protein
MIFLRKKVFPGGLFVVPNKQSGNKFQNISGISGGAGCGFDGNSRQIDALSANDR